MTKKKPLTYVVSMYRCIVHRKICDFCRCDVNLRLRLEKYFAKKNNDVSVSLITQLTFCYFFKGICACEFHLLGFQPIRVLLSDVQKPKL